MLAALALGSQGIRATTETWNGTGTTWATTTDWTPNSPVGGPASGDTASFDATGNAHLGVSITAAATALNIQFLTGAGSVASGYSLNGSGSGTLTLSSGGSVSMASGDIFSETVNVATVLGGASPSTYSFTNNASSPSSVLLFGSTATITGANSSGSTVLTLNGSNTGTNTISGVISDSGLGGTTGLTKSGTGNWTFLSTTANTYTGTTTILGGTLVATNLASLGAGTSNIILGDTTTNATSAALLIATGGTYARNYTVQAGSAGEVYLGNLSANSSGTTTMSGNISLNRNVALISNVTSSSSGPTFSGNITDATGSNAVALVGVTPNAGVNTGLVFSTLTGVNSYGGGTFAEAGNWQVTGTQDSLGSNNVTINGGLLSIAAATNLTSGKTILVNQLGALGISTNFSPTSLINSSSSGLLLLDANSLSFNTALNMTTLGNGSMFLGGVNTSGGTTPPKYSASSLGVGSGNTYRLGGGGDNFGGTLYTRNLLEISNGVLTDTNVSGVHTAVIIGSPMAGAPTDSTAPGRVQLDAANTYAGGTTINDDSFLDGKSQSSGTPFGSTTATITLHGGGLEVDNNSGATTTTIGALNFDGPSALITGSTSALTIGTLTRSNQGTMQINQGSGGIITVTNGVTLVGGIVPWAFSDAGTYGTFLTPPPPPPPYASGTGFTAAATSTFASGTNASSVNATGNGGGTVSANTTYNSVNLQGSSLTINNGFTLTVNSGAVSIGGNANSISGLGTLAFGSAEGIIVGPGGQTTAYTNTVGTVITGSGGLTITSGGPANAVSLTANNSAGLTGTITLDEGVVSISGDTSLGNASNPIQFNGGALNLNASSITLASTRTITLGPNIGSTFTSGNAAANTETIASLLTGTSPYLAFDDGNAATGAISNTFTLTNTGNNFTAPIFIDGGYTGNGASSPTIVSISNDAELGTSTNAVSVTEGGVLQDTGNGVSSTRAMSFTNGGGGIDVTGANTYTVNGVISGDGNLIKSDTGALVLTGSNTLTGNMIVTGGTLIANNTMGSATGTGALAVTAGATLAGTGASSGSGFSISGTGTSTPAQAAVLVGQNATTANTDTNTMSNLVLKGTGANTIANANLVFNLNAQVAGGLGGANAGGTGVTNSGNELSVGNSNISFGLSTGSVQLTLNIQNQPAIIAAFTPYVLIAGTSSTSTTPGTSTGQYAGLTLGATTTLGTGITETLITGSNTSLVFTGAVDNSFYGANSYLILYQNAGSGIDDIDVEVVPEPSTWAMILGGLALLVFFQRRKRA